MRIHCLLPFLRKLKSTYGPRRLLLEVLRLLRTNSSRSTLNKKKKKHMSFTRKTNVIHEETNQRTTVVCVFKIQVR